MTNISVGFYTGAEAITPSDTVNIVRGPTRGIYVGGAGNIVAVIGGTAITFNGAQAGDILPIHATRVNLTSTTATSLVALY